jgi:hypothetical protein
VLARLVIPKPQSIAPGHFVYTCVANVASDNRPHFRDQNMRGCFLLKDKSSICSAEDLGTGELVDAFRVAVASASIPVIVHPTRLAGMTLLDGGLVANLPADFVLSNGAMGGAYVICIVPRDVTDMSKPNVIDYRTLQFLFDLRDRQASHRRDAATSSTWSGPAHTHIPIFIISPRQFLKSRMMFFWPPMLRREFWQGFQEAKTFSDSLGAFSRGDMRPMSDYLLENVLEGCEAPLKKPGRPYWYMWANTRW